jgi:hypothetical protein
MMIPALTTPCCRNNILAVGEVALRAVEGRWFGGVKSSRQYRRCNLSGLAFTIALAAALPVGVANGQDDGAGLERPAPNVQRQIDRLDRGGSVDPLTRRRLEDQLRREPRSADRSAAERTLDRLPSDEPAPAAPLPESSAGDSMPSSLRPGFGGSGGGPGTSGHMVPPGGRSGAIR